MKFFQPFLRNLGVMILIIVGAVIFMKIFYPDTIQVFSGVGQVFSSLGLWPIMIILVILAAVPRKKR